MLTLDKVLEPLKDGKWHDLKEIKEEVGLPDDRLEEIIGFFAKYEFIQLDRKRKRARLAHSMVEFFTKTE